MRIGTWNLAGRWDERHAALIETMDCDVLLLTEVSGRVELPAYNLHLGQLPMAARRRWAAVASQVPFSPEPDPYGASAPVDLNGLRVCASVLPWRSCGTRDPWGRRLHGREDQRCGCLPGDRPADGLGGDWNLALSGREWSGSVTGRRSARRESR